MSGATEPENDRAVLAGEYVLGLLDEASARAVEAQAAQSPALAAEIAAWRTRLDPLAEIPAPAAPSDPLWHRINASLPPRQDNARPQPPAAAKAAGPWRALALASMAVAAGLAAFIWYAQQSEPRAPWARAIALLSAPGTAQATLRAQVTSQGTITVLPLSLLQPIPGHHMGFWAWPKDRAAPILLGTLPAQGGQFSFPYPVQDATPVMVTSEPDTATSATPGPTLYLGLLATTG